MEELKSIFQNKAKKIGNDLRGILKDHGGLQLDTVSLRQVIGGMRGIKCMFAETSHLDPNDGIKFRGYSIPELQKKLPKGNGEDRKSTRLNSSHVAISYAVFCLKKKKTKE